MNYLIGIDGGATKTKCVVTDYEFHVVHTCEGGPSNFLVSTAIEAAENIAELVNESFDKLQIGQRDIAALTVGAAGAGRKNDAALLKDHLVKSLEIHSFDGKKVHVVSDADISLEGAFSGDQGIILISGTGSICIGKNDKGESLRVGGYGRIIGDEGSGFKLGQKAISAALRSFDGRCLSTKLYSLVLDEMGVKDVNEVIRKVYQENYDVAQLAPMVLEAAKQNDETAQSIIDEQSDELMLHLRAMLQLMNTSSCKIAFIGSLINSDNLYSSMLEEKAKRAFPGVVIQKPEHPPEIGAAMLARKFMGVR